jgi:DNA-binding SARP family transcriptional activator
VLSRKDAALLARLALDGRQARSAMAAWLWPDVTLPRAHANLRQRLFRLRQAAGALVQEADDGLQLATAVACDLQSDAADFAAALLAGLPHEDDAVQDWLDDARRRWGARRADHMSGLATRHEAAGALAAALALTEQLLVLEPLLEHAWRRLMRLHYLRGDRAAAVAAFERCERVLRDELGLAPSPETQALLAQVEILATLPQRPQMPLPPALLRPPRLVGRQLERQTLAAAWQGGQAFLLLGEAGLGKSRLLADLAQGRSRVLQVAALPGDGAVPYALMLRLLRALAAGGPADALWPQGLARKELARLLPELGPAPAAPGLDALLQAALHDVFVLAARAGWVGVLVDDLHQADAASAGVLRTAAAAGHGLQWGFASRPSAHAAPPSWLASSARLQVCVLAPLDNAAMCALIGSLDLPAGADTTLHTRLAQHCGGNPLFVLETLKHLALQPPGAGTQTLPLPASVETAIASRLATLSPTALALLRVAAVAAGDSHPALAADVLGTPLAALADAWREAEAAQLLREDGTVHDALCATVLAGLPRVLRGALHERVAAGLQRRGAAAAAVARHLQAAGLWAAAGQALLQAATDALRLGRSAERLAHLGAAAQAFDTAGDATAHFDARLAAVAARMACDGPDAALADATALQPLAVSAAQRVAWQLACAELALGAYRFNQATVAASAALLEADAQSSEALQAEVMHAAAQAMLGVPLSTPAARARLARLRPRLDATTHPVRAAHLWSQWAIVQHGAGRPGACLDALERQLALARTAGHTSLEVQALASLGGQRLAAGDAERSIADSRHAAALYRRLGDSHGARLAELNLAIALIGCDHLAAALAVLDGVAPAGSGAGTADYARIADELRAEAWWRAGRPGMALQLLGDAPPADAALARQVHHALLQALAVQALGDGERAAALWRLLWRRVPAGGSAGVALRAQALASVVLPAKAARKVLGDLVARGEAAGAPAAAGLARLRRAACAWRDGDLPAALLDVEWLLLQRARLRHLYLPTAEWLSTAAKVLEATGHAARARTLRGQARSWFETELRPELPTGCEAAWLLHPAWAGLVRAG